jgi:predicted HTH transcriptional regulator
MAYSPFDRDIRDLDENDLDLLIQNEVSEGYWVEYKSEVPVSKKIAKSIASFSNTFGGWYFLGVEADKTKNVAKRICGLDLGKTPDPISSLRDSVKAHIDPTPVFHYKLVELKSGRAVLVVHIPDNQETPFITSDGRIYRRVNDSSDLVPESNRYAV